MSQPQHIADRYSLSTALFGMMVLALGMGIGRFLYPHAAGAAGRGRFTFSELSWIASVNYAGYGRQPAVLLRAFHLHGRLRPMLLSSAVATSGLILAMALFSGPGVVMLVRFLAGVASAGMLIFGSTLVLQHTRNPFVIASLFSGVGVGIALGNEYVIAGLHFALFPHAVDRGGDLLRRAGDSAGAAASVPRSRAACRNTGKNEPQPMRWWLLALLYGLAGFGYIIVATYLPLMAKTPVHRC